MFLISVKLTADFLVDNEMIVSSQVSSKHKSIFYVFVNLLCYKEEFNLTTISIDTERERERERERVYRNNIK